MEGTIADVRCPSCDAAAKYDIIRGRYLCTYCGSKVEVQEALAQKQGFRSIQQEKIRQSAKNRRLLRADCPGYGAELVFEEGEAMSNCAFCGRTLVRRDYLSSKELPEMIIPFRITREEAVDCVKDWCQKHTRKAEAKHLKKIAERLEGFYLPYELVRGPVDCQVSRMDGFRVYRCHGYVDNVFVNCSRQLNNLLLDGAEPFELDEIRAFDFSYTAGQRVKIGDITADELKARVSAEVSNDYGPVVRKTLETTAVNVQTGVESVLRLPVLLPVYYISSGNTQAAVNGQTGKVSVQAEKESHYFFLPWWLKAILSTIGIGAAAFAAFYLFGMELAENLYITGMLSLITFIITLVVAAISMRSLIVDMIKYTSGRKVF